MPLNRELLVVELRKFMDPEYPGSEFPQSAEEAKNLLADAVFQYSRAVIPACPLPVSESAKNLMAEALGNMNEPGQGVTVIKNAILTYAQLLGNGIATLGFTIIPPSVPAIPPFLDSMVVQDDKTAEDAANEFADIVHNWFITWKATNNISGVTVNWS